MTGFGVVIRTNTEKHANEIARKISDLMDEARMNPIPVDVYKFETDQIPGIDCQRAHYCIVG